MSYPVTFFVVRMLFPGSSEMTLSTIIMGNRCFRTARTSSNFIKAAAISNCPFLRNCSTNLPQHISRTCPCQRRSGANRQDLHHPIETATLAIAYALTATVESWRSLAAETVSRDALRRHQRRVVSRGGQQPPPFGVAGFPGCIQKPDVSLGTPWPC